MSAPSVSAGPRNGSVVVYLLEGDAERLVEVVG